MVLASVAPQPARLQVRFSVPAVVHVPVVTVSQFPKSWEPIAAMVFVSE